MDFWAFFVFVGVSGLLFFNCRNSTLGMIDKVGRNPRFYPKHYVVPNRTIKKLFDIQYHMVPRYLYYEFYISIAFVLFGVVTCLAYLCTGGNKTIAGGSVLFQVCLGLANMVYFVIVSSILKKR